MTVIDISLAETGMVLGFLNNKRKEVIITELLHLPIRTLLESHR
jgi:hypothetical protein